MTHEELNVKVLAAHYVEVALAECKPERGFKTYIPRGYHLYDVDGNCESFLFPIDENNVVSWPE